MSCGGKPTNGWSANMPAEKAIPVIAGLWASRIKKIGSNVTDQGVAMNPGQQTACVMSFGTPCPVRGLVDLRLPRRGRRPEPSPLGR